MLKWVVIYLVILLLSSLPVLHSLFPSGFFLSHDGPYHLVRLIRFYTEITQGQFPVRFGRDMVFGYGYPLFNFFYPLPYYLGALIHFLGFDFSSSLKIVMSLSLICSIIFCYLWLKSHFGSLPALVGAFTFLYAPYRFLATYVSGDIGIVVSFALAPLLLFSLYHFLYRRRLNYLPLFSVSLFLLILSHNVSALIFFAVASCYGLWCLSQHHYSRPLLISWIISLILAFGLASFFILPLLHDLAYVNLTKHIAVDYRDHWVSLRQLLYSPWGYGYSNANFRLGLSVQLGFAQWFAVLAVIIYLLFHRPFIKPVSDPLVYCALAGFSLSLFLMLPLSDFIWRSVPLFPQIQFPWRLLAVSILLTAFLASWLLFQLRKNRLSSLILAIIFIGLAFVNNRNYLRPLESLRYPDSYFTNNYALFNGPTDIAYEARPKWVTSNPTSFPSSIIFSPLNLSFESLPLATYDKVRLKINVSQPADIILNLFYYPTWQVFTGPDLNHLTLISSHPDPTTGLIHFTVPATAKYLVVRYQPSTFSCFADYLSLVFFILWLISIYFSRRQSKWLRCLSS